MNPEVPEKIKTYTSVTIDSLLSVNVPSGVLQNAESPSRVSSTSPCTECRIYIISSLFCLGIV